MTDSPLFQAFNRAWNIGNTPAWPATPPAWPATSAALTPTAWKNYFFECPVAVSSHLQRFIMRQAQEQVQLLSELSRDPNPVNAATRQAAFLQQSAYAWSTEMVELAELVQSKLLASGGSDAQQSKPGFPTAA